MTALSGYTLEALLEDSEFVLFRGRADDGRPAVLVRAPRAPSPTPAALARLEQEYALREELDAAWAARPLTLVREHGRTLLVLEDAGGTPLAGRLGRPLETTAFLRLGLGLAAALAAVHARGLIHKDVKPANILVDAHGAVRLTGFGFASRLPRERPAAEPPELIAGTLAYMAPEQTGRMNRSVDARADLYALGVTFYEMLTGTLPFHASDPMEWVHCHIAREAPAPSEFHAPIPAPLSALVMKLLAKTADERYQSAAGLSADLADCLAQWQAGGRIEPFPLGRHDVPERLQIPEKLYGREREVGALLAAFDRVAASGAQELVLVRGYSGIGKSAVVHELHRAIVAPRALFAAGKFDQYRRDIPYATLAQAFRTLVRQLLIKGEAELAVWRDAIRGALGPNGQLMIELVPELELIIGRQSPCAKLAPQEAENRFHAVFRRFLGVFAHPAQPLALFLDDLQWLDAATLKLLAHLLTHPEVRHLLVIGAYRDNEVGPAHPLTRTLAAIAQSGARVVGIALQPLSDDDVGQLVADALRAPRARTESLARLVHDKTAGNPFFAIQFLNTLWEERLLAFDAGSAAWTWDREGIDAKGYTDNVVDLMVGKLRRLHAATQAALQRFGCLGNSADVATLAIVYGAPAKAVHSDLWAAVSEGLLLRLGETYKFLHDRVQEAAYALIPEERRAAEHLRIGRLLVAHLSRAAVAERIFEVTNQFNQGVDLITDAGEREMLRRLNARAGRRAKAAIAYASALNYLRQAIALLRPDAWRTRYEETFALYRDRAECEYLVGHFPDADEQFARLLANARSALDRAKVCRLRSRLYQAAGQFEVAMTLIVEALHLLDVNLPASDEALAAAATSEMDEIRAKLRPGSLARLADAPRASDPRGTMIIGLLVDGLGPAYAARPPYFPLLAAKAVSGALRYGNTVDACTAYNSYAIVLIAVRQDIRSAFEFSELALALLEKFDDPRSRGLVLAGHGGLVLPWRRHIALGIPFVERGLAALLDAGDFVNAAHIAVLAVWATVEKGESLDEVLDAAGKYLALTREIHNATAHDAVLIAERLVANLKGSTHAPASFDGDGFSEADCLARFAQAGWHTGTAYYWVMKEIACFLYGQHHEAVDAAARAEPMLRQMTAMPVAATLYFYRALAVAALFPDASAGQQQAYARTLHEILHKLEFWADNCPQNFENRHALVAAEWARIEGRELDAERLYEQAIRSARNNGFVHNEALAHELAGKFHLGRGLRTIALPYLLGARACYARWGAEGKVSQLARDYPELGEAAAGHAGDSPLAQLDVLTVVKASQAVSGEIVLERVIEALMTIALEHAGAQRGLLLMPEGEGYRVAAEATIERESAQLIVRQAPSTPTEAPEAILRYVQRTRESVLLDDAAAPNLFSDDAYLRTRHPRSLLCLPLVKHGRLGGMLYLENPLTPGAFTRERVAVLELLASQAAISLENASLYNDLREENAERQRAEQALSESRARLAAILGSARDAVVTVDAEQRILLFNAGAERMFGYRAEEAIGGALDDLIPERFRAIHREHVRKFGESGTTRRSGAPLEVVGLRANGEEFPVDASISRAQCGGQKLLTVMLRDSTERKRAEADHVAREAAEAANRAKSAFFASMSHELRTPLNAVLGYARLLQREPDLGERQTDGLATIEQSGEHLLDLINDLLDLAKVEAGRLDLAPLPLKPAAFLPAVVHVVQVKGDEKGLPVIWEASPELPSTVLADERRLRQILLNLLGNAVKFTDRGEVRLRVQVLAREEDVVRLRFEVTDTGVGVAADELKNIFKRFEQAGDLARRASGTGLGLAISQQLVRLMGSEIQVDSTPGAGSRFWFDLSLPVLAAEPSGPREEATVRGYAGPRRTVLVVDDVSANRAVLAALLGELGFTVVEADNGQAALEQVRQATPDLVVMDLVMPVMDGLAAIRNIRGIAALPRLPIVAVSASTDREGQEISRAAGADAFLAKPIDHEALLHQIGGLLGLSWLREESEATGERRVAEPLSVPPREEMEVLHRLAVAGDMRAIRRQAGHLAGRDVRYRPFAEHLDQLAKQYQSKAVLKWIERCLERSS